MKMINPEKRKKVKLEEKSAYYYSYQVHNTAAHIG